MDVLIKALSLIRDDELIKLGHNPDVLRESYYIKIFNSQEVVEHIDQIDTLDLDVIERIKEQSVDNYLICLKNLENKTFDKYIIKDHHLFIEFYLNDFEEPLLQWQLISCNSNGERVVHVLEGERNL